MQITRALCALAAAALATASAAAVAQQPAGPPALPPPAAPPGASQAPATLPPPPPAPYGAAPTPYGSAPTPYGPAPYGAPPATYPAQPGPNYPPYAGPPLYAPLMALPEDAPEELPYDEEQSVPWGYRPESRIRKGLVIGGAVTLGVSYALVAMVGVESPSSDENRWLLVPVVGPFITMALHDHSCKNQDHECDLQGVGDFFADVLLTADGLAQATGAALLTVGLAAPYKVLVRADRSAGTRWLPMPTTFGGRGIGVSVTGVNF